MARPRKGEEDAGEDRIYAAFWQLARARSLQNLTVSSLVETAGCNRSTFYYYFADIEELLEKVVDKTFPSAIPRLFGALVKKMGGPSPRIVKSIVAKHQDQIDKICLLLDSPVADRVRERLLVQFASVWESSFGIDLARSPAELAVLFEFVANGLMSVMAYRARTGFQIELDEILAALTPEISNALFSSMGRLSR